MRPRFRSPSCAQNTTPEEFAAKRAALVAFRETAAESEYAGSLRDSEFARQLRNRNISFSWGRATIVNDHPDKVLTSSAKTETHLAPQLREIVDKTKHELFLVSPYFMPGKQGVELLAGVRQRGSRVVVITNSLASTDGVPVHSKYKLYRKSLLQAGVELYELKPTAGALPRAATGQLPRTDGGSGNAGLHAKTFAFDRRIAFVGSYNLDPRSANLTPRWVCSLIVRHSRSVCRRRLSAISFATPIASNSWETTSSG